MQRYQIHSDIKYQITSDILVYRYTIRKEKVAHQYSCHEMRDDWGTTQFLNYIFSGLTEPIHFAFSLAAEIAA